jgi:hypothetical protein
MTVFSNQTPGGSAPYAKVYEFAPPVDATGKYSIPSSGPFEPAGPVWSYSNPASLQATNLSGAERLENGNTLISAGPQGRLFEVTPSGNVVWEYWSPYSNSGLNGFSIFRAVRIRADHPSLAGRNLNPLEPQPPPSPFAEIEVNLGVCPASAAPSGPAAESPTADSTGANNAVDNEPAGANDGNVKGAAAVTLKNTQGVSNSLSFRLP